MKRKARKEIVTRTWPYAAVETALAQVFDAAHVQKTAFRWKLKNFRKLGMPQHHPGRGAPIQYTQDDVYKLMLCVGLSNYGIDPSHIVKMVRHRWDDTRHFSAAIAKAVASLDSGDDLWIAIPADFNNWGERVEQSETRISFRSPVEPFWEVRDFWTSKASEFHQMADAELITINLTKRVRAVRAALATLTVEPVLEETLS
jgi:hypothetical protein